MDWKEEFRQMYEEDNFRTDSDIIGFAEERNLDIGKVMNYFDTILTIGTPCEGCKHIGMRYSISPCNHCSRRPGFKDMYESK